MWIVGMDTSTRNCSVALACDGEVVHERSVTISVSHSRTLLPFLAVLLDEAALPVSSVDGFAVAVGPGSFTGLRIGISVAKGLSLATGKPVVGIPTLDAVARCLPETDRLICPILDAKRGELFAALYAHRGGELRKLTPEMVLTPEALCERISSPTVFMGDGLERYGELLAERLGKAIFASVAASESTVAGIVAKLGYENLRQNGCVQDVRLKPIYLRRSDAEIKWEERKRDAEREK